MGFKKSIKQFRRVIARHIILWILAYGRRLSFATAYRLAYVFARTAYLLLVKHKRYAHESLRIAFGDSLTPQEVNHIIFASFHEVAKNALELQAFIEKPGLIDDQIRIIGREHLDRALAKKKGVVAITGHFGNFPLLSVKLARVGYPIHMVRRIMRDPWVHDFLQKRMLELGIHSIFTPPRRACAEQCLRALHDNGVIAILFDQNFGGDAFFVNFFGKKAATARGPIVFAMRSGAPLVPIFIRRTEDSIHEIIIEPEVPVQPGATKSEQVLQTAQVLTDSIELFIRRNPTQWAWFHRRWKTRPPEEQANTVS